MTTRILAGLAAAAMVGGASLGTDVRAQRPAESTDLDRPLVDRYCINCHSERRRSGGLVLEGLDPTNVGGAAETWEKVARRVRTGEMPPAGVPGPDVVARTAFLEHLESALDRTASASPNPGRPAIHRLNRAEYANAIRDLLAVDVDAQALLPHDDADHGFDNIAGVLTVSPLLVERYMSAAHKISRLAVGDPSIAPSITTYSVPKQLFQDDQMSEELPFGSRGGMAIRHEFPLDGDYTVRIRLRRNLYDYIRGLGRSHRVDVRLDGVRVKLLTVGGEDHGRPAPATYAGNISGDPRWEEYTHSADAALEARFHAPAGNHTLGIAFLDRIAEPEGILQPRSTGFGFAIDDMWDGDPAIDSIAVNGPLNAQGSGSTPSRSRIFGCQPSNVGDEKMCARRILSTLARRAYRRPVTDDDVTTLMTFYDGGRKDGAFESGIQTALERLLADPDFLFRIERDPSGSVAGRAYPISSVELASRLSFFLWSSIPDDELLDAATTGRLTEPAVLEQQARRMLADGRAKSLVDNFAGQWLYLRNLSVASPDPDLFPDFDDNLRESFLRETQLFVESQLREDRSVIDLVRANYTFVNERLARHYGISGIYGNRFRRVTFNDGRRGGLLGQGSILTVTSYGNRTSPVLRGKWLLDNLLGAPPPPPPPDVPSLKESGEGGKLLSVRERLEEHRKNPACMTCHVRMDPLGFALENYDAIGKWRDTSEGGTPVDASGRFPDGTAFNGPAGLRALLVSHQQEFVTTVAEKLLTYGLGRGLEYYDRPAVREIVRKAAARDDCWSALILGIVQSTPFQMRRSGS